MKSFKTYLEEEMLLESPNLAKETTKLPANLFASVAVQRT